MGVLALEARINLIVSEIEESVVTFNKDVIDPKVLEIETLQAAIKKSIEKFDKRIYNKFRGVQVELCHDAEHIHIKIGDEELLFADADGRLMWAHITDKMKDIIVSDWETLYSEYESVPAPETE